MAGQHDVDGISNQGSTTQDLGARYAAIARVTAPLAAKRPWWEMPGAEQHVQTRGRWMIIGGAAVGVLILALSVVWNMGFSRPMPAAYVLPLYAFAFGAIAIGGMEYLSRSTRYVSDLAVYRINQVERQITALVGLLDEQLAQKYYEGVAEGARAVRPQMTGTEHARPLDKLEGEVLPFLRR